MATAEDMAELIRRLQVLEQQVRDDHDAIVNLQTALLQVDVLKTALEQHETKLADLELRLGR